MDKNKIRNLLGKRFHMSRLACEANDKKNRQTRYNAVREFCLDCGLLTFKEIEELEYDVLQKL